MEVNPGFKYFDVKPKLIESKLIIDDFDRMTPETVNKMSLVEKFLIQTCFLESESKENLMLLGGESWINTPMQRTAFKRLGFVPIFIGKGVRVPINLSYRPKAFW